MARGVMWEAQVRHEGLGKFRLIRGSEKHVVEQKAFYQEQVWNEQWQVKCESERRKKEKEQQAEERIKQQQKQQTLKEQAAQEKARQKAEREQYISDRKQEAVEQDIAAKVLLNAIRNTLNYTLDINDAVDWNALKDVSVFAEPLPKFMLPQEPEEIKPPTKPIPEIPKPKPDQIQKPTPPDKDNKKYQPVFGLLDHILSSARAKKQAVADAIYQNDLKLWQEECVKIEALNTETEIKWGADCRNIESKNTAALADWEKTVSRIIKENADRKTWWGGNYEKAKAGHDSEIQQWETRKGQFLARQQETNAAIDQNKQDYFNRETGAILDYCDTVLSNSQYPDFFPQEWDFDYNTESKILVLDYMLPAPESLPTVKEVQYVQSRDEFKESCLSEKELDSLYDSLLYQVALRTIHELFEADTAEALQAIAFNGIVTALDKTTGNSVTSCVMSVMVQKDIFLQINLANIDPKACFKSLKGVAAAKLTGITAVPPVMIIDKEDRRIVASYAVLENVSEGTNLATMDWEDFEHLIREVFEKEFSVNGGEVKVTQASRDGGVDAIAFDPDPIRGGKIVIQAKRYTNVVGVSAVRDLYGTVINEGATKGILVTTAAYGPDAYEFAKGKPLSLLTGGNLLHLLERHGHHAYININEAKLAQNK